MKKVIMVLIICMIGSLPAQENIKKETNKNVKLVLPKSALCSWTVDVDKTFNGMEMTSLPPKNQAMMRKSLGSMTVTFTANSFVIKTIENGKPIIEKQKFTIEKIQKNIYTLKCSRLINMYKITGKTAILEIIHKRGEKQSIYLKKIMPK